MIYIIFASLILIIFLIIEIRHRKKQYEFKLSLGLKFIYPDFHRFIKCTHYYDFFSFKENTYLKVKDTIEFLEYKFPIYSNQNEIQGYYHLGLLHSKKPLVYCYCINSNGLIINGGKEKLYYKRKTDFIYYTGIFRRLISDMEKSSDFQENFCRNGSITTPSYDA
jgi:hypothetical protein